MMAAMSEMSKQPVQETEAAHDGPVPSRAEVRVAAMNLLARRDHARSELQVKLQRRFADTELVCSVLDVLSEQNLQSDARYAESLLRQRLGRGYGPLRIRQEMRERGLDQERIAVAFESVAPDWFTAAAAAYERKFGDLQGLHEPAADESPDHTPAGDAWREAQQCQLKEKARRMRFMQYRGFLPEHYRHLLEG